MGGRVRVEKSGAIGWIVFDQPARRNAISAEMWQAIPGACRQHDEDDEVRVIVLKGEGDEAFVAGADISEFNEKRSGPAAEAYANQNRAAFDALTSIRKPVIAQLRGFCVGGGAAISVTADLRYAADDAVFAIPAAKLGLGYQMDALETLTNVVGFSVAKEMFFTARRYSAEEALGVGLVNAVVPAAELESFVEKRANQIARNAPITIRSVKGIVRELAKADSERDREGVAASIAECYASEDYAEGVAAFLEKRSPEFRGR